MMPSIGAVPACQPSCAPGCVTSGAPVNLKPKSKMQKASTRPLSTRPVHSMPFDVLPLPVVSMVVMALLLGRLVLRGLIQGPQDAERVAHLAIDIAPELLRIGQHHDRAGRGRAHPPRFDIVDDQREREAGRR